MNKLFGISLINVLFCIFMSKFLSGIILYTNDWHITYIFIVYAIMAIDLFLYQRWINKKVLPYFGRNKHEFTLLSLSLSYTIVGVVATRILTIINSISYIIKLGLILRSYPGDISNQLFAVIIFYNISFITITGMTFNGLFDIKIRDIKKLRWKDEL